MNGPRRILDGGGDELAMTLLRAAKDDRPGADAKVQTLAALGLGAAVVGTAATATAGTAVKLGAAGGVATAAGTTKSTVAVVVAKWLLLGALGGGLVAGSAVALDDAPQTATLTTAQGISECKGAAEQIVARAKSAALSETPAVESAHEEAPTPAAAIEPKADARAAAPVNKASKSTPEGLAEELALIDKARVAVASGQGSQALKLLDEHDRRFAGGQLAPEALVLRIEALVGMGRMSDAARLGDAYLAAFPKSAYARRVRSLLGRAEAEGGGPVAP